MSTRVSQAVFYTFFGAAFLGLMGCASTKKEAKQETPTSPATETTTATTPSSAQPQEVTIGKDWTALDSLKDCYFDFDKADLREDARSVLKVDAGVLKKLPRNVQVIVEGYCDERGTIEYNLALGQRRANAVKDYYAHSGISAGRLKTISYGKEHPVCTESTEDCWARNRRSATKVRSDRPVTVQLEP